MTKEKFKGIVEELNKIEGNLKENIHPFQISTEYKSPFKFIAIIEIQTHRIYELGSSSLTLLKNNNVISSLIINRTIIESIAYLYYLLEKLEKALNKKDFEKADQHLMEVTFGGRNDVTEYVSVNVLTAIDKADKKLTDIRNIYDMLSEYTHPNYTGVFGYYCSINEETLLHTLGPNSKESPKAYKLAKNTLETSLQLFSLLYDMYMNSGEEMLQFYEDHYDE